MNYTEFSKKYHPEKFKGKDYIVPAEACDSLFNTHKITPDDTYRIAGNINCSDEVLKKHVFEFDGESVVEYISRFKFPEKIAKLHIFTIESGYVAAKSASKHVQMLNTVIAAFKSDMKILLHMKTINRKPMPKNNYNKGVTIKKVAEPVAV